MNETEARTLREAHNAYVKRINRMSRAKLAELERQELADRGIIRVFGGPVTRDEFISSLCEIRYPITALNEASHVIAHDVFWPDCEFCQATQELVWCELPAHEGKHSPRPDCRHPHNTGEYPS
jgi:hypothetical protein